MYSNKWWKEWTIVMLSASVGFGALGDGTVMAEYSPTPPPSFIRTITLNASGCADRSPTWWFLLAVQLQDHQYRLDTEERLFIANVINRLTVSEDAMPTPEHQVWLCNLKKKLGL